MTGTAALVTPGASSADNPVGEDRIQKNSSMKHSLLRGSQQFAALAALGAALLTPTLASANNGNAASSPKSATGSATYSGQALALRIDGVTDPTPGQILLCDTGPLPAGGGVLHVTRSDFTYGGGALTVAHADSYSSGSGPQAVSHSTLSGYRVEFVVQDGDEQQAHRALIEADYIYGEASATADKKGDVTLASNVIIQGLKVNGQPITVTGRPNQRVDLPAEVGGWLILNEQANAGSGNSGDIVVSAIHFYVCHCIEGHVGLVRAGLTANGTPPASEEDCGKVTGGGWIIDTPSHEKGTFGMSGGIRRGEFWGHLTYNDHGASLKVQSTAVTNFQIDPTDPNGRIITYAVTINGVAGTATLRVVDRGEPGRNDIFDLRLSTGYRAAGDLGGGRPGGGNIQLHKCPPGWE